MGGLAFGVKRIPSQLPGIVYGLFTGLNASAVGLVALASYQLAKKVVTDHTSRVLLVGSACVAMCYESQWLYPVLVAVGGITTLMVDSAKLWRATRTPKEQSLIRTEELRPVAPVQDIEMLPRPAPVAVGNSSLLRRTATKGSDEEGKRYPTPPLELEERDGSRRQSTLQESVDEHPVHGVGKGEEEEEVYFTLSIKAGLAMYVYLSFSLDLERVECKADRIEPMRKNKTEEQVSSSSSSSCSSFGAQ